MAYLFNGSTQYLSTASSPASGSPMTIAAWVRMTTAAGNSRAVTVGVNGGTHRNQVTFATNFGGQVQAVSVGTSVTASSLFQDTANSVVANGAMVHSCAVFESQSSRIVYANGTAGTQNTTNVGTQNTADTITVGAGWATTIGTYHTGDIAEVGVWNVALTAAEVASLAKGVTCDRVRPQSLVFYAPLIRDLVDLRGGRAITNNNTATVSTHPRVYA
jgi:hypothetical protein